MDNEKKWRITFNNGYGCCSQEKEFVGTYEEAEAWATENLKDYAESINYIFFGWNKKYNETEFKNHCENCSFDIEEWRDEE